ncbi:MAG: efflux RND transporter periplasmic adaptor subunit [Steroidobacteraceae bacterium]
MVEPQSTANIVEVPGRVQAVRSAEVRARVDGIVERRLYDEGSDVRAGQELFQIDPRDLRANVSGVKATLMRAEASVANAAQDVARYTGLVAERAISEQEFDAAVARLRTAEADVNQIRTQLERARLSLSYTTVVAPIAGRAGRAQVTEGALVSAAGATLLTTIEQLDPVFVNFSRSSADLLRVRRELAAGTLELPRLKQVAVTLLLEDGSSYAHEGHLDFFDLSIDKDTGTAALRAEFPNPERALLPGQFVRARIQAGVRPDAVSIPQRAVTLTPQGASVMVVGKDDVATTRAIKVGALIAGMWEVQAGLKKGDRVIVDGLQKVQPGQSVRIGSAQPAAAPANDASS